MRKAAQEAMYNIVHLAGRASMHMRQCTEQHYTVCRANTLAAVKHYNMIAAFNMTYVASFLYIMHPILMQLII